MNITPIQKSGWLELKLEGRLDAAWSEHLFNTVNDNIRQGRHDIRIDARGLEYLSSAGMRALLRSHKALKAISGSFAITSASEFVIQTLSMSGFTSLLALETKAEEKHTEQEEALAKYGVSKWDAQGTSFELYEMDPDASMDVASLGSWTPWAPVEPDSCRKIQLGRDTVAIGTGAPGEDYQSVKGIMGDFVSSSGCTAWLQGNGSDAPDYLIQEGRFVPEIIALSALRGVGGFSHLLRFQPSEDHEAAKLSGLMDETMHRVKPSDSGSLLTLSALMDAVLSATRSTAAAFTALVEVEGLVGVSTARSPGLISQTDNPAQFPDVRDWMTFCGERVHGGAQAMIVGFVDASKNGRNLPTMPALPSREGWRAHVHAAVFPFKPIPNGKIFMSDSIQQIFTGAEPIALMHLLEDNRPTLGLGQSVFRRGACWCSAANFTTEGK